MRVKPYFVKPIAGYKEKIVYRMKQFDKKRVLYFCCPLKIAVIKSSPRRLMFSFGSLFSAL